MAEGSLLTDSVRKNIPLIYSFAALINVALDRGVWMLFLSYRGLGLVEIGLVESAFQLSSLVFGVPAGVVGDLLGRKASLVLCVVSKVLGYVIILSSHGLLGFAAGFALNAVSGVLYQSASESLAYDSCKIAGLQGSYKKIYGNLVAVTFVAAALGIIAGGMIATSSYEWVYYASIALLLCGLVPAALLTETRDPDRRSRRSIMALFSGSVRLIADSPLILYLLVLYASITVVDLTIYMYCQEYYEAMSIPLYLIGAIFCLDAIFAALAARYAYLLERYRNRDVVLLIPAVIIAMYLLLALIDAPVVVLMMYTATIFVVAFWPILSELINARVPSENRATVLSMKAQLSSLGIMLVFPVAGLIASRTSLSTAFLWLVVVAMPLIAYCVVKIRRIAF